MMVLLLDSHDPAGQKLTQKIICPDYTYSSGIENVWDGLGFIIYKADNSPVSVWFDIVDFLGNPIGPYSSTGAKPSWIVGSEIVIQLQTLSSNNKTSEQMAILVKSELDILSTDFTVAISGEELTVTSTPKTNINEIANHSDGFFEITTLLEGSSPVSGLDAFDINNNPVKTGIMVLVDDVDNQDDILEKTAQAFNNSVSTDQVLDALIRLVMLKLQMSQ